MDSLDSGGAASIVMNRGGSNYMEAPRKSCWHRLGLGSLSQTQSANEAGSCANLGLSKIIGEMTQGWAAEIAPVC